MVATSDDKIIGDQRLATQWQQQAMTKLLGLNYRLVYRKGLENKAADALSCCNHVGELQLSALSVCIHSWVEEVQNGYSTRGGVLLACDENFFSLSDISLGQYSVSATITMREENLQWSITVVYGPQLEGDKIDFLAEIEALRPSMKPAWMIIRDFNLIYKSSDKNNDRLNRRMMQRFGGLLDKIQVKELHLSGRRFTWTDDGEALTQTKIDRAFVSTDWDVLFSGSNLYPLSSACSNHAPLFLVGNESRAKPPQFCFEAFWLQILGFLDVVQDSWQRQILASNPLAIFRLKLCILAHDLKRWSRSQVSDIKLQFAVATEVIFQLDVAQESRILSDEERQLLSNLKSRVLGLSVLNKIKIRQ